MYIGNQVGLNDIVCMKEKVINDPLHIFPQIISFLRKDFQDCEFYLFGSRTKDKPCIKCDFDIAIVYQGNPVKFLQDHNLINPAWRRKVKDYTGGKSLSGDNYYKALSFIYAKEKEKEVEAYFSFMKDEYGKKVEVDIMFQFKKELDHRFIRYA